MRVFEKPFCACLPGEIYPKDYAQGDECPEALVAVADSCGVLAPAEAKQEKPKEKAKRG